MARVPVSHEEVNEQEKLRKILQSINDALDVLEAGDNVTGADIADDAVSVEHLDDGILPSHVVKYAGEFTTVGGDATEVITVTGVTATDLVFVISKSGNANVLRAVPTTNTITVTMSADPGNDDVLAYMVLRAVA